MLVKVEIADTDDTPFFDPFKDDSFFLLREKELLESEIHTIRERFNSTNSKLTKYVDEMSIRFSVEHSFLNKLKAELRELKDIAWETGQETQPSIEEMLNSDNEALRSHIERNRQQNENLSKKKNVEKSSGSKRLFKLIAAKAHPDKLPKTKDAAHLTFLFNLARKAYDDNDYTKLEKIYSCILRKVSWSFVVLENEVEELREQNYTAAQELNMLHQTTLFYMMSDYFSGDYFATIKSVSAYQHDLQEQIHASVQMIRELDPTRYTTQSQPTFTL